MRRITKIQGHVVIFQGRVAIVKGFVVVVQGIYNELYIVFVYLSDNTIHIIIHTLHSPPCIYIRQF